MGFMMNATDITQGLGYCLGWNSSFILTQAIADVIVSVAFLIVTVRICHYLFRSRKHLTTVKGFKGFIIAFVTFYVISSVTLLFDAWGLFIPRFTLQTIFQALSAVCAIVLSIQVMRFLPIVANMPSPIKLMALNDELKARVNERDHALAMLRTEIEDRESAEAALHQSRKMEAIGQLTGGIAHDFNNLLQAMSGNLELVTKNTDSDKIKRWVKNALNALTRGSQLTAQLMTFSRVQRLQIRPTKLFDLINNILPMIQRTLGTGITISADCDPEVVVTTDPVQLELAILNLCINARDAMPNGTGTIQISTTKAIRDRTLPSGKYIDIDVTDNGIGMTNDIVERVFEPFFTTKDVGAGTGLGLSMVYGVATQSGGIARVKNTSVSGTTMTITLPVTDEAAEPFIDQYDDSPIEDLPADLNVMVVDDDDNVRGAIMALLENHGLNVVSASDGVNALMLLKQKRPDILLLDFAMPVMDGSTVAKAARNIYPDLPIVFVTGHAKSAMIEGYPVLRKPFQDRTLVQIILEVTGCRKEKTPLRVVA